MEPGATAQARGEPGQVLEERGVARVVDEDGLHQPQARRARAQQPEQLRQRAALAAELLAAETA